MEVEHEPGMTEKRRMIVEELLAGPTFKEGLRLLLKDIDPDAGPVLVRTVLGRDVEVPLAVVSTLPALANLFIRTAMELVHQVRTKYPSPLLAGMAESLLQDVDSETLARLLRELSRLGTDLAPALESFRKSLKERKEQP